VAELAGEPVIVPVPTRAAGDGAITLILIFYTYRRSASV